MCSFFGLSEHAEIHQVPGGHSSQQLMASVAMLLKELTPRNALRAGLFKGEAVVGEVGKGHEQICHYKLPCQSDPHGTPYHTRKRWGED